MNEVRIQITFTTGTTIDDPGEAKQRMQELLHGMLVDAGVIAKENETNRGLFFHKVDKVEAEKL